MTIWETPYRFNDLGLNGKKKKPKKKLQGRKATGLYSTCIHCKKSDKTFIKTVKKKGYTGKRIWCARCKSQASF